MLSYLTCEIEEGEVLHPVVVVDHLCTVGSVGIEIEELCHLILYALLIVAECLVVEEVTLLAFSRRVADHTCGTAHQDDWFMSAMLKMAQHHYTTKVTYVE